MTNPDLSLTFASLYPLFPVVTCKFGLSRMSWHLRIPIVRSYSRLISCESRMLLFNCNLCIKFFFSLRATFVSSYSVNQEQPNRRLDDLDQITCKGYNISWKGERGKKKSLKLDTVNFYNCLSKFCYLL